MRVDADVMKSLFDETINNIVSLVKDVLRKPAAKNVPLLLLVGGFAECPVFVGFILFNLYFCLFVRFHLAIVSSARL
jgi:hypothetical protein